MNDKEKLILIAQVFGHLKGTFTAQMLYYFIFTYKYKFNKEMTLKRVGVLLSRSNKIRKIPVGKIHTYEVI